MASVEVRSVPPKDRALEGILWLIKSRGLKAGDRLPAERDLCEEIGVSRTALRAAIARLISCNTLESRHGAGTFVCPPKPLHILQTSYNYTSAVKGVGATPSSRIIYMKTISADAALAQKMELDQGSNILVMQRIRYVDDSPASLETAYINLTLCPGIENYDFEQGSLYEVLRDEYDVVIVHGHERISITRLNAYEADLLQTEEGSPAFFESSVEFDKDMNAIELCKAVSLPNRFRFADNGEANGVKETVGEAWLRE